MSQKSLAIPAFGGAFALIDRAIPHPASDEILVKITASALNPVDWKLQVVEGFVSSWPSVFGTDIAGQVHAVGNAVVRFAVGDRVLHQGAYNNNDLAGFQQYSLVKAVNAAKIPSNLSFDQAATLPVGYTTAVVSLYQPSPQGAGYTAPWAPGGRGKYARKPILITGGSTSVGQYAIQLAVLSGFSPIITTAASKHLELLTALGATHVIDRSIPLSSLSSEIAKITSLPLEIALDSVSHSETQNAAYAALAPGGQLSILLPAAVDKVQEGKTILQIWGLVSLPPYADIGRGMYMSIESYLKSGAIKPNQVEIISGGLNGVVSGLERMKKGEVSATKLVVRPQETV